GLVFDLLLRIGHYSVFPAGAAAFLRGARGFGGAFSAATAALSTDLALRLRGALTLTGLSAAGAAAPVLTALEAGAASAAADFAAGLRVAFGAVPVAADLVFAAPAFAAGAAVRAGALTGWALAGVMPACCWMASTTLSVLGSVGLRAPVGVC